MILRTRDAVLPERTRLSRAKARPAIQAPAGITSGQRKSEPRAKFTALIFPTEKTPANGVNKLEKAERREQGCRAGRCTANDVWPATDDREFNAGLHVDRFLLTLSRRRRCSDFRRSGYQRRLRPKG